MAISDIDHTAVASPVPTCAPRGRVAGWSVGQWRGNIADVCILKKAVRMYLPSLPMPRIPLSGLLGRLPTLPLSSVWVSLFNALAWRGLRNLDWSAVQGRRFRVHVRDLGVKLHFSVDAGGLRSQLSDHADVVFTATARDFMRLALRIEDPDTLFFNRRLLIKGNTDLGLTVKNMLDAVELDDLLTSLPAPAAMALRALRERILAADALPQAGAA